MEGLVDTSDLVILGVLAAAVFFYFARSKSSSSPQKKPAPKPQAAPKPSSNASVGGSGGSGLNAKMNKQKKDAVIFYGSQTGTAEDYANRLSREAKQYGFDAMVADLEDYQLEELSSLETNKLVIFVVATYGEGEPTDNAQESFKYLTEGEAEEGIFKNVRYCVFGLGNKTYEHFNEVGKIFDKKFEELGATRVFRLGLGDDDGSLEEDYTSWRDEMWPTVCNYFGKEVDQNATTFRQYSFQEHAEGTLDNDRIFKGNYGKLPKPGASQTSPPYDLKNPYYADMVVHEELMKGGDRSCMHIEFKIKDTPLSYQTGDHLGIFPMIDAGEVERIGKRLGIEDLNKCFTMTALDSSAPKKHPFPQPCSYRTALTYYLDTQAVPRTHILKALIEFTSDPKEKETLLRLVSPDGKEEAHKFLQDSGRNLLDVLEAFPSAKPPVDLIFELLPRLQCRYYSISSSPEVQPETISVCAVVSEYQTATGRLGKGVCTNWLSSMKNPHLQHFRIPVFVRRSNFKLPKNLAKPIIMVGPGTGVAPFRAFIGERAKKRADQKSVGANILFFGCRREEEDFLYVDELRKYEAQGDLQLFCAFSRATEKKVYVQHLMAQQKKLIWSTLEQGGYLYICGDAKNMARDVSRTIVEITREVGGKSEDEAVQFIKGLKSSGRYLEDVWS